MTVTMKKLGARDKRNSRNQRGAMKIKERTVSIYSVKHHPWLI